MIAIINSDPFSKIAINWRRLNFGFWNADFGFKVFCLFYEQTERTDSARVPYG